jgi:hypothetical protein
LSGFYSLGDDSDAHAARNVKDPFDNHRAAASESETINE